MMRRIATPKFYNPPRIMSLNQFNVKLKTVRYDNRTEFVNGKMNKMFSELGCPLMSSKMKSKDFVDAEFASETYHLTFFDNQTPQSLYDERRATLVVDGSVPSSRQDNSNTTFWSLYQLDVNNALLHGDLVKDFYMTLPQGYDNVDKTKVCKLNKSLYGDSKPQGSGMLNSILLWPSMALNDIVITSNDEYGIKEFKEFLSTKFLIKDFGVLKYFIGIEILENENGFYMSQRKYCLELLYEYGLLAARPVDIPLPEKCVLSFEEYKKDKYHNDFTSYQKLMGKESPGCRTSSWSKKTNFHCFALHLWLLTSLHLWLLTFLPLSLSFLTSAGELMVDFLAILLMVDFDLLILMDVLGVCILRLAFGGVELGLSLVVLLDEAACLVGEAGGVLLNGNTLS
ncbi:ribonuclease H-like domain-containing protein [Tanacetum coccineum]